MTSQAYLTLRSYVHIVWQKEHTEGRKPHPNILNKRAKGTKLGRPAVILESKPDMASSHKMHQL